MPIDVANVFSAKPASIKEVFAAPGFYFYIPQFQRPYDWNRSQIDRLFENIQGGLNSFVSGDAEALTFLGSLVYIRYATTEPLTPKDSKWTAPASIMLVIDGQQRMTTLMMVNVALMAAIRARELVLQQENEPAFAVLLEQATITRSHLRATVMETDPAADGNFFPRMTRANEDCWSRYAEKRYRSPIAALLDRAISCVRENRQEDITSYSPGESCVEDEGKRHAHFRKMYDHVVERVTHVAVGKLNSESDDDEDSAEPFVAAEQGVGESLGKLAELLSLSSDNMDAIRGNSSAIELCRLVGFARFILDRVAVTSVASMNERYAFDIFEALNTTGEPLTAFDTFRPLVIREEGAQTFPGSPAELALRSVDNYLGSGNERRARAENLLIPFALAESGTKLSKRLNMQRRYMMDAYASCSGRERKLAFVRHLSTVARFFGDYWSDSCVAVERMSHLQEASMIATCLSALRSASHTIVAAPLSRFLGEGTSGTSSVFGAAVLATTAFFGLYRGARQDTGGIDAHYRRIMADWLAWSKGQPSDIARYKAHLRSAILGSLGVGGEHEAEAAWINAAAKSPVYAANKALAKLLLFAAVRNTRPSNEPGMLTSALPGSLEMFTTKLWSSLSVEHIAPVSKPAGWSRQLYADNRHQRLGNLTLLPVAENAVISDSSWTKKRAFYGGLVALTEDEVRAGMEAAGSPLKGDVIQTILASDRRKELEAITAVKGEWTAALVDKRSENLARLAWRTLWPWLSN